jgi:hypothetical protein
MLRGRGHLVQHNVGGSLDTKTFSGAQFQDIVGCYKKFYHTRPLSKPVQILHTLSIQLQSYSRERLCGCWPLSNSLILCGDASIILWLEIDPYSLDCPRQLCSPAVAKNIQLFGRSKEGTSVRCICEDSIERPDLDYPCPTLYVPWPVYIPLSCPCMTRLNQMGLTR